MPNKIVWLIVGFIAVAAVAGAAFFFANRETDLSITVSPTPVIASPTASFSNANRIPTSVPTSPSQLDWKTYRSPSAGFSINYPPDIQVNAAQENAVVFNKLGPTQAKGTELFDGFNLSISSGIYSPTNFESFKGFVESERQKKDTDPATEKVGDVKTFTIAGKEAYQFDQKALGNFTLIYIPTKSNNYLMISKIVADPGDLGFEETVNKMLATLSF